MGVSLPNTFPMKKHLKSRNPALNIPRRHEAVATDTVFSDTPAVDSGVKQAQVFVRRDTLWLMHTQSTFFPPRRILYLVHNSVSPSVGCNLVNIHSFLRFIVVSYSLFLLDCCDT